MSRYVDVEYFRDLFDDKYLETVKLISSGKTYLDNLAAGFTLASQIIGSLPTADVEEVKHGYWLGGDGYTRETICSECDYSQRPGHRYRYCPNCGAKMDL